MAITKATTYTCSDGTQFTDEFKANDHEQKLDDLKFSEIHGCGERASKWLREILSAIDDEDQQRLSWAIQMARNERG